MQPTATKTTASTPELSGARWWVIISLILAGEAVFFLPFVLPRVFRPTFLEVFDVTNYELGLYYSVYGIVAIFAYLLGGPLADRFPARKLITLSLISTALGGLLLAADPSVNAMRWLYGFWGCTTILLLWAAMLRATRLVGGPKLQGLAFGVLDGGRGLFAALVSSGMVFLLAWFMPVDVEAATSLERDHAFRMVIYALSGVVLLVGVLVWWTLRFIPHEKAHSSRQLSFKKIAHVAKIPAVWLQALIILCAYSGYRVTDDFSLLAQDALGYDEVQAAGVGSMALWLRPIGAVLAGLLADRFRATTMITVSFLILIASGLLMGLGYGAISPMLAVVVTVVSTALAVYGLRGLYFAVMGEVQIPLVVTGTAVGVASLIGYLPDVYMAPLMGVLLDASPGVKGHQHVFLLLSGFAGCGLIANLLLRRLVKRQLAAE